MITQSRKTSVDVIRIIACFLVCSVHFFLNTGYYSETLDTKYMFFFTVLRTGCMVCVPLFLILSGYLMGEKKMSPSYYWGLEKTLLTYLLVSIVCMIYKKFVIFWLTSALEILSFKAAPYSWYVEMYIGLYLLIPIFNLAWKGLTTDKQRKGVVICLLILTTLPSVLNIFNFETAGWWSVPSVDKNYLDIVPDWWIILYPVTYYFTGMYLRYYPPKLKKAEFFVLLIISVAVFGIFNCYRSNASVLVWGKWQDWGGLPTFVMAVLLFRFIESFNMNRLPNGVRWVIAKISDMCLGTYLLSWIPDNNIYNFLNSAIPTVPERMKYFFIIPLIVFTVSSIGSLVILLISTLIHKILPVKKYIAILENKRKSTAENSAEI